MANSSSGDSMLDRLVRILDSFDADHPSLTVTALARRSAVPRATAYRLVEELVGHGLLARTDDGSIGLGLRLWELSNRASLTRDLRLVSLPYMEDINHLLQQNTHLSIMYEDEVLIVERLSRPGAAANQAHVAGRMPVLRTSMGMALLAFSPPDVTADFLARHVEDARALHPHLQKTLAHIRLTGHATLAGFTDPDTTGVAVPILNERRHADAVISVVVPTDSQLQPAAVMALRTAAGGIARALAGAG